MAETGCLVSRISDITRRIILSADYWLLEGLDLADVT